MLIDAHRPHFLLMMPRVVADQRQKFETDELFVRFSRLTEVRYAGYPIGGDAERRARLIQDCRDGKLEISFIPSGFNLELHIAPSQPPGSDFVDIASDPPKIHICSHFILNGVCVRWRGWLDRNTLGGQGRLEFDTSRAQIEHQRLQQELRAVEERLDRLQSIEQARANVESTAATSDAASAVPTATTSAEGSLLGGNPTSVDPASPSSSASSSNEQHEKPKPQTSRD